MQFITAMNIRFYFEFPDKPRFTSRCYRYRDIGISPLEAATFVNNNIPGHGFFLRIHLLIPVSSSSAENGTAVLRLQPEITC